MAGILLEFWTAWGELVSDCAFLVATAILIVSQAPRWREGWNSYSDLGQAAAIFLMLTGVYLTGVWVYRILYDTGLVDLLGLVYLAPVVALLLIGFVLDRLAHRKSDSH
jgi:hypothetical protein